MAGEVTTSTDGAAAQEDALLYACNGCEWVGRGGDTVAMKHGHPHHLCPECHETTEPYTAEQVSRLLNAPAPEVLADEGKRADLHADLNRRAAEALGSRTPAGMLDTWHDISERITALRAALAAAVANATQLRRDFPPAPPLPTVDCQCRTCRVMIANQIRARSGKETPSG